MNALAARRAVEAVGGMIRAEGGGLVVRAPVGALTPGLLDAVRARKAELLAEEAAAVADLIRRAGNCLSPETLADEAEVTMRGELT